MADKSAIEWTDATWNPIVGCSLVSPGCTNCYAMEVAWRIHRIADAAGRDTPYHDIIRRSPGKRPVWNGKISLAGEATLFAPLRWKRPRRIFVNSMGDLFHDNVANSQIDRVFAVMALAPQHTFQVLTKRSKRMREYLTSRNGMGNAQICRAINEIPAKLGNRHGALEMPLPNVWVGVSAEDQPRADERIPDLLATPAAVRFVSAEPLLGPSDFRRWLPDCYECGGSCGQRLPERPDVERCTKCGEECGPDTEPVISEGCPKCGGALEPVCPDCGHYMVYQHPDTPNLDWVIVGGESGPGARPMHPDWARSIRDQCAAARVPFFFKQFGEWASAACKHPVPAPAGELKSMTIVSSTNRSEIGKTSWHAGCGDHSEILRLVGKARAGRLLDGVEHNGMPEPRP